ncbi:DoxX family protein [Flavihumibacter stibioxidans]|uniref:DoxX family protein n=1 Tax=Flavihumibacter stibioxidans TaxID=1834163 RepID=A0ABR7M877_9BACT|nr:DoxX family protein [Flavihumibacter stibioxidans]MBC6491235.1 hypothetical protein [Flavihumibacter stibioxidans]
MKKFLSPDCKIWYEPGMAFVRILTGLFMVYHGWEIFNDQKMQDYAKWLTDLHFPYAATMAFVGKAAELLSGFLLTLGLFTRLAVIPLACTMLVITFGMGKGKIFYEDQHPFLFVLISLVFFFAGPGKYSLDHILFGRNK